jgi:hypothetical protein
MSRTPGILIAAALVSGLTFVVSCAAGATTLPAPGSCVENCGVPGQTPDVMLLNFDENGNGTIALNGGPAMPLSGTLMADPSNPGGPMVLTYLLPQSVYSGTVEILDPASQGGGISDALRFTDASGTISGAPTGAGTEMIYYSNATPDPGDLLQLADSGFPSNLTSGNFFPPPGTIGPMETVGPGGSSFDYQPGGFPYPANNEYIGISDVAAAPEPVSLALLGSALAMMGFTLHRRQDIR